MLSLPSLPLPVEEALYRIAQEALTNVARHAQCDQAKVKLWFNTEDVVLEVSDKGVGIDAALADSPERGWGLEGMRERAESVSGQLHISSPVGGGTIVEVIVPINEFSISPVEEKPDEQHPVNVS